MNQMSKPKDTFLVEVQPLVRGLRESSATYFSGESYTPGSVIVVPFRSKERAALVLSVRPLYDLKAEIKSVGFALRKINQQKERVLFTPHFLSAVQGLSDFYATSAGEIISSLVPVSIIESDVALRGADLTYTPPKRKRKTVFVQADYKARLKKYKEYIKKTLSKGGSVMVLTPTVESARRIVSYYKDSEFADSMYALSSGLTKKKQVSVWAEVVKQKKALVVIVTPGFLSLPLQNLDLCINDEVGSSQFIGLKKPYLDARVAMNRIAKFYGARLILGDILIPLSRLVESDNSAAFNLAEVDIKSEVRFVDMTADVVAKGGVGALSPPKKRPFRLISDELLSLTEKSLEDNKKVFWFVARRGLYPSTVCRDCGTEHACDKCGSSLVLHQKGESRVFLCHRCGHREETLVTCKVCSGWRLEPLGVGVEGVFEEAEKEFGKAVLVSSDTTNTKAKIKTQLKNYYELGKGALLVSTDIVIPFLEEGVDVTGVVSIDSRLSLPIYNAEESALRSLLTINSLASEVSIVQTRRPDNRVFSSADGTNLDKFRKQEEDLRRAFQYPPFGVLVSISVSKDKEGVESLRKKIADDIGVHLNKDEKILLPPLRGTKKRGVYTATIILKLAQSLDKNVELQNLIRSLPPGVTVCVEPENLW